ncbi:MAG: hypothetical protein QW228_05340 [Candidatus Aenigmatarchaeota archaeon]
MVILIVLIKNFIKGFFKRVFLGFSTWRRVKQDLVCDVTDTLIMFKYMFKHNISEKSID